MLVRRIPIGAKARASQLGQWEWSLPIPWTYFPNRVSKIGWSHTYIGIVTILGILLFNCWFVGSGVCWPSSNCICCRDSIVFLKNALQVRKAYYYTSRTFIWTGEWSKHQIGMFALVTYLNLCYLVQLFFHFLFFFLVFRPGLPVLLFFFACWFRPWCTHDLSSKPSINSNETGIPGNKNMDRAAAEQKCRWQKIRDTSVDEKDSRQSFRENGKLKVQNGKETKARSKTWSHLRKMLYLSYSCLNQE